MGSRTLEVIMVVVRSFQISDAEVASMLGSLPSVKAGFWGVGGRLTLAPATRAQGERSAFAPDLEGKLG